MSEKTIYEFRTPEGDILEWEGPDGMDDNAVKVKFYQSILKDPSLSPTIAKQQGYKEPAPADLRSAGQVATDQAWEVGKGAAGVIPGMLGAVGGAVGGALKGTLGWTPQQKEEGRRQFEDTAAGVVHGVVAPFKALGTSARGLGALAAPESVDAPSRQDWEEAAQTGGATAVAAGLEGLGKFATPERLMSGAGTVRNAVREMPKSEIPLSKGDMVVHAAKTVARPVANAGAAVMEKIAKIRAGRPLVEGQTYAPETENATFPVTDDPIVPDAAAARQDYPAQTPEWNRSSMDYDPSAPTGTPSLPTTAETASEASRVQRVRELRDIQRQQYADDVDNTPLFDTTNSGPPMSGALPENTGYKLEGSAPEIQRGLPASPDRVTMPPEQQVPNSATLQNYGAPTFDPQASWEPVNAARPEPPPVPVEAPATGELTAAEIRTAEEAIHPLGNKAKQRTGVQVPELLAEVPELRGRTGKVFDNTLLHAHDRAVAGLRAAEDSIPPTTHVNIKDVVQQLTEVENNALTKGWTDAARSIGKIRERFTNVGNSPLFKEFLSIKRGFFDEVKLGSYAGRQAYAILAGVSDAVNPALTKANRSYYIVKSALEDAGIDLKLSKTAGQARRVGEVGKVQKVKTLRK